MLLLPCWETTSTLRDPFLKSCKFQSKKLKNWQNLKGLTLISQSLLKYYPKKATEKVSDYLMMSMGGTRIRTRSFTVNSESTKQVRARTWSRWEWDLGEIQRLRCAPLIGKRIRWLVEQRMSGWENTGMVNNLLIYSLYPSIHASMHPCIYLSIISTFYLYVHISSKCWG